MSTFHTLLLQLVNIVVSEQHVPLILVWAKILIAALTKCQLIGNKEYKTLKMKFHRKDIPCMVLIDIAKNTTAKTFQKSLPYDWFESIQKVYLARSSNDIFIQDKAFYQKVKKNKMKKKQTNKINQHCSTVNA